jgi:anti-sigma B factor antagonist
MADNAPAQDQVLVATSGENAFLRAVGRATLKFSTAVRDFTRVAFSSGCRRLLCDLRDCSSMDSTFMGVLAGLATRKSVDVILFNLSPRLVDLVSTLGLDQVARAYAAGAAPADLAPLLQEARALEARASGVDPSMPAGETVLEAHETLVQIHAPNLPRFQSVLNYLREDLENRRRNPGGS